MRIWAFPSFYPLDIPGMRWSGTFAHRQYQGLIAAGADLKVVVPVLWYPPFPFYNLASDWKRLAKVPYPAERIYDGIKVYHPRIRNGKPSRLMNKPYRERYIQSIIDFFKDNRIKLDPGNDVFYAQWLSDAVFVVEAAHRLGVKCATLGIGDDVFIEPFKNDSRMNDFKTVLKASDASFFNADYLGRESKKISGLDLKYDVTYFGVDYKLFKPASAQLRKELRNQFNFPQDKLLILNVASPLVRKGWLELFDAVAELKKERTDFMLIAGYAGPQNIDIPREIANRSLGDICIDYGEVKPADLNKLYNCSDIFCLPSHWEGLPTVVMESMACGMPVISTNVCGIPEIIDSGKTGILVGPKDPGQLFAALRDLCASPDMRNKLGNNAREFIVSTWGNANENSAKLLDKFKALVSATQ